MNKLQERKNNKGFSLVELIIVIAIMAVLVAILAPAFMRYVEQSRQKADISATDSIIQSVKAAYTNSEFAIPADGTATVTLSNANKPVVAITGTGGVKADLQTALANSDVDDATFKSNKWGTVILTFEEATTGALDVTITESGEKDGTKMSEEYNGGKNAGTSPTQAPAGN